MLYRTTVRPITVMITRKPVSLNLKVTALKDGRWTVKGIVPGDFGIDTTLTTRTVAKLDATFFGGRTPTFHQLDLIQPLSLPSFNELAA